MAWRNRELRWQQTTCYRFEVDELICNAEINAFEVPPFKQKRSNVKSPSANKKNAPEASNEFYSKVTDRGVEIYFPLRTVSEANCFEPWQKRHKRHKAQKRAVMFALIPLKQHLSLPCTIRITRFAPKMLDAHDNLRISVKYILDQTCAEITQDYRPGLADGRDGFTFEYAQEKTKGYGVKIEIITKN